MSTWLRIGSRQNRTLQRACVFLVLAAAHALPIDTGNYSPLKLPGGGSVPVAGKPVRQNSLNFKSRSNSPELGHTEVCPEAPPCPAITALLSCSAPRKSCSP
jgi:hypothetical protein